MKTYAFSVFDRVAEVFNTPFFMPSRPLAQRTFSNLVIDGESQLHKNPADYAVYELGAFDDKTGLLEPHPSPQLIIDAEEVLNTYYASQDAAAKKGSN